MTESLASSSEPPTRSFHQAHSNSFNSHNNSNNRRRQPQRPGQMSSQDVRYVNRPHYHSYQQRERYPYDMYHDQYYEPLATQGEHFTRNHQQQRRSQFRHGSSSSQTNHRAVAIRPDSNSSIKSTNEIGNLRATLTDQLLKNSYECMICINKIK